MYTCLICDPIYVKGCYPVDVSHYVIVFVGGCVARVLLRFLLCWYGVSRSAFIFLIRFGLVFPIGWDISLSLCLGSCINRVLSCFNSSLPVISNPVASPAPSSVLCLSVVLRAVSMGVCCSWSFAQFSCTLRLSIFSGVGRSSSCLSSSPNYLLVLSSCVSLSELVSIIPIVSCIVIF